MAMRKTVRWVMALWLLWLGAGSAWAQVVNGGFDSGALAPWTSSTSGSVRVDTDMAGLTHGGSLFVGAWDNNGIGSVSQAVNTVVGTSYTVSAWVSSTNGPPHTASIRLGTASPAVSCTVVQLIWTLCTGTFVATSASEPLALLFSTTFGTGVVGFDDVTITAAPVAAVPALGEGGLWVLILAAAGLAATQMRRRS